MDQVIITRIPGIEEELLEAADDDLLVIYDDSVDKTKKIKAKNLAKKNGMPDPANQAGKVLYSNGTVASWETIPLLAPTTTKTADYTATDGDANRLMPFDLSDATADVTCYVPTASGRTGKCFFPLRIDANTEFKLIIVSVGGGSQINFGNPLYCLDQGESQPIQSNGTIYLPYLK